MLPLRTDSPARFRIDNLPRRDQLVLEVVDRLGLGEQVQSGEDRSEVGDLFGVLLVRPARRGERLHVEPAAAEALDAFPLVPSARAT